MEIVNRRLAEMRPYENNPRFNDDAVDAVAASIQEFGFKVPIVLDSEGVIVAGHTRWKAALKLQLETVPCVVADDLTPEQIKAFRLADNKVAELAYWDEETLAKELEGIADIDMSAFGFEGEETDLGDEMLDNPYTSTINIPQYEITGKKPSFAEMLDTGKADELLAEIEQAQVSEEERAFLIRAAHRHNVFHYGNVAEYYAHASPEMQALMERSGLVIIDVDNAIANGFARLASTVSGLMDEGKGDEDDA